MKKRTLGAVLLAAGNSSRYGGIKLLEKISGVPMYQSMLMKLKQLALEETVVVTQYEVIMEEAIKSGFLVVKNNHPQDGISHSIQLGIEELKKRKNVDGILFCVCDQPFIKLKTLEDLKDIFMQGEYSLICTGRNGKLGNPCIIARKYFDELMQLKNDVGGKKVIRNHLDEVYVMEAEEIELKDVDTKDDAEKIRKLEYYI